MTRLCNVHIYNPDMYQTTIRINVSKHLMKCFFFCFVGSLRKLDQRFSEFKFLQEPEDVVVVRNKPAILHCEASLSGPGSSRNVKIKWKRDGEFLNFPDFNDRR